MIKKHFFAFINYLTNTEKMESFFKLSLLFKIYYIKVQK